ncbi:MAG: hypothetical protein C4523_02590 [Myxococcales bacterium]|jgi:hypothetical protein|nr:MAG: hypothetical protein C4523_02590 [Myxococcales bacterium]
MEDVKMRSKLSSLTIKGLILTALGAVSQVLTLLGFGLAPEEYAGMVKFVEVGFEAVGLLTAYIGRVRIGDLK